MNAERCMRLAASLRYTLYGDANLDRTVDTIDFNQLAGRIMPAANFH